MTDPLTPESLHDLDWGVAKAEDSFFRTSPRYPFFANLVVDLKPSRLFDLGCGSGYLVHMIKQQLPELEASGIDISQVTLERATHHFEQVWKLNVDQADLRNSGCIGLWVFGNAFWDWQDGSQKFRVTF